MDAGEPLKTVVALEQLHHEWYLLTKEKTNNVRHVEWLLERTTCIQKALAKWMPTYTPRSVLTWGYVHIDEEISLLESDLNDISRSVLTYRPSEERMLENPMPSREIEDMVNRMIRMSAEIREMMWKWGNDRRDDPSAVTVVALFDHTCAIQGALLRDVAAYPTNIRKALERSFAEISRSSAGLRRVRWSIFERE